MSCLPLWKWKRGVYQCEGAQGLHLITAVFFLVGKCLSGSARRLWQEREDTCVKRSSVEAVLWGVRRTFFLESHISAHCTDFPWHTEIIFLSFCPAQCLLQNLNLAYLILILTSLWRGHCLAVHQVNSFVSCLLFVVPSWRFPTSEQDYFSGDHLYLIQSVRGIICSTPIILYLVTKSTSLQLEWVMRPVPRFPAVWRALWELYSNAQMKTGSHLPHLSGDCAGSSRWFL